MQIGLDPVEGDVFSQYVCLNCEAADFGNGENCKKCGVGLTANPPKIREFKFAVTKETKTWLGTRRDYGWRKIST